MINSSVISSISLSFNNSWIAHIGSRIYRIATEALEGLFGDTFFPSQLYSGKRLYQLVDTYRQSKCDGRSYDQARWYYAGGIALALKGETDPLEKTRKAKSIVNTHIMGLSILQGKDKASLSKHISYTLLPSLIDEFGRKMASNAILALHELDSMDGSGNDNPSKYVKAYRDIALQQKELDSFVQALDQLHSGISKDILINELLLARNRNLSKTAKEKIAAILQSEGYVNIKLQNKLHTVKLLRGYNHEMQFDENAVLSELQENRNNQLEALRHSGPSMFFESDKAELQENQNNQLKDSIQRVDKSIFVDKKSTDSDIISNNENELDNISLKKSEEELSNTEKSIDSKNVSLKRATTLPLPVGICNSQNNCWYNTVLQILIHTPIYQDILQQREKFASDLPNIFRPFKLYEDILKRSSDCISSDACMESKRLDINSHISPIREEAHDNLDKEFNSKRTSQEDSQHFLHMLLRKLFIPVSYHIWMPGEKIPSAKERHLFLDKPDPSQLVNSPNIASVKIDLKSLFADTDHQLYGIIFHAGADYSQGRDFNSGHYFAAVKMNGSWYLCNDLNIVEISETEVENLIQKGKALLITSRA